MRFCAVLLVDGGKPLQQLLPLGQNTFLLLHVVAVAGVPVMVVAGVRGPLRAPRGADGPHGPRQHHWRRAARHGHDVGGFRGDLRGEMDAV